MTLARYMRHRSADLGGFSLSKFLNKASGVLNRVAPAAGAIGGALGISNAGSIVSGSQDVLRRLGFGAGSTLPPQTSSPVVQPSAPLWKQHPFAFAFGAGLLALTIYKLTSRRR